MATRNEFGDICLDAEETRNFIDKMIHPDEEALRKRDEFLAECPEFECDENGDVVIHIDHARHSYACWIDPNLYYECSDKVAEGTNTYNKK